MPVGANGDSVPARAPLPAMTAIWSSGMPARAATAIAGGARSALAGVAPAPMVAMMAPRMKNMIGRRPACPRHRRTARAVTRASVPLTSAMLKSSVTPTSVTSSARRKPFEHHVRRHAAQIDADDQRHRHRQDADVDRRRAAERDGDDEGGDRNPGEAHRAPWSSVLCVARVFTSVVMSPAFSSDSTARSVSAIAGSGSTSSAHSVNFSWSSSRVNGRSGPPR